MEPLDLRQFLWTKDHKNYSIIAITNFQDQDVVVYKDRNEGRIDVASVSDFCRDFTATYQVSY